MRRLDIIFLILIALIFANISYAKNDENPQRLNDYLYSSEYFDYLIECASIERQEEIERKKQEEKQALKDAKKEQKHKKNNYEVSLIDDVVYVTEKEEEIEPFKLHIRNTYSPSKYSETFKKEDTKTIIPIGDKFSFIQNMSTSKNKYSSTDYKILAGAELEPLKFLKFGGGLETNYRGLDQNPASRKIYLTPELKITNKIKLAFPNKYNIHSGSTDHDIGLNISPFKSKFMDFGVYAGLTRTKEGKTSESVNFSTNFYLF